MAAITTHQEDAEIQQDGPKPPKEKSAGTLPSKVEVSHAALERDIHTRHWAERALVGRTLTLRGSEIHIQPPIDLRDSSSPPWTNDSGKTLAKIQLFTETSKMGAPSYSLPVGPLAFGGSCPGSTAGMTTGAPNASASMRQRVLHVINATNKHLPPVGGFEDSYAVCQNCYVTKGNHGYWGNNLRLVARYAWTRAAVQQGLFAPSLIEALRGAKFAMEPPALAHLNQRYFRIHDAGDFFSADYLEAWWQIAKAYDGKTPGNPRIVFWAPTRIWATKEGSADVKRINGGKRFLDNFVIRPSGYVINAAGPDFPIGPVSGYASPTTVDTRGHADAVLAGTAPRTFDWLCPAQEFGGSCLGSPSPAGDQGCRVCWIHPELRTAYKLH